MEKVDFSEYIENTIWRRSWLGETEFEKRVIEDLKSGDYWRCAVWFELFGCTRTFGGNLSTYNRITDFIPDINPFEMPKGKYGWFEDNLGYDFMEDFFFWERKHGNCSCKIIIRKTINDKYAFNIGYSHSIGGGSAYPNMWNKMYDYSYETIVKAKSQLYDKLKTLGERNDTSKKDRKSINNLMNILLNLKWDKQEDKPLEGIAPSKKRNYLQVELKTGKKKDESPQLSLF